MEIGKASVSNSSAISDMRLLFAGSRGQVIRVLLQFVLILFSCVSSWASDAENAPKAYPDRSNLWVQFYGGPVIGGFSLKPAFLAGVDLTPADVYVAVASSNYCRFRLYSFSDKKILGPGYMLTVEGDKVFPNFDQSCFELSGHKSFSKDPNWPKCEVKANDVSVSYFAFASGKRPICIYKLHDAETQSNGEKANSHVGRYRIMQIEVRWEADQPQGTIQLLSHFFASAPYWQPSLEPKMNARACNQYAVAIGAFGSGTRPIGTPYIENSDVRWAYSYLVRVVGGYRCADTRYRVDLVTRPLIKLSDGTALVYGNRTVLRVRMVDGSTDAPPSLVKYFPPRKFIETVQADAQKAECMSSDDTSKCRWLQPEGWHERRKGSQVARDRQELNEDTYGRVWLQGFDQAIQRIYFGR